MSLTQTEKLGFGKNVLGLVDDVAPELEGTPLDPAKIRKDLAEKYERAATANARQEEAKRVALESTAETDEASDELYRAASGYLDAIMGVVGKGSPAAKNMQRLRSRIRMPADSTDVAGTPGDPAPHAQQ